MSKNPSRSVNKNTILAIMVVAALILIPYRFSGAAMQDLSGEAEAIRLETSTIESQIAEAAAVAEDRPAFERRLESYTAALPAEPRLSEVINQVSSAATAAGVRWTAGAPAPVEDEFAPIGGNAWTLSITVEGSPAGAVRFLEALRGLPRLVVVESVSLQGSGEDAAAIISARFFSAPSDAPVAVPDSAVEAEVAQ